ncbi:hypothetical protein DYB35_004878 [Aphanomyces astaci]|uniref:Uncharacterized protein n=1 Tax=Aphanomyces astaci TaxID=112090 RepID=A0A3R6X2S7_APHAT|nr:hypothetical protein DYB35_004878 [Aphanomyces astaci]
MVVSAEVQTEQSQLHALQKLDEQCVQFQLQGNYVAALECMERALVLRRHFFGLDAVEVRESCKAVAEMCNLLSMTYLQQENYGVTLELLKKAEILTENHPQERATTLNNMACYYRRIGKLHGALTCLKRALAIELHLNKLETTADTHLNLCAVLSTMGKHAEAVEHAQSALILLQDELFSAALPLVRHQCLEPLKPRHDISPTIPPVIMISPPPASTDEEGSVVVPLVHVQPPPSDIETSPHTEQQRQLDAAVLSSYSKQDLQASPVLAADDCLTTGEAAHAAEGRAVAESTATDGIVYIATDALTQVSSNKADNAAATLEGEGAPITTTSDLPARQEPTDSATKVEDTGPSVEGGTSSDIQELTTAGVELSPEKPDVTRVEPPMQLDATDQPDDCVPGDDPLRPLDTVETANEAIAVDSKVPLSAQSQLTLDTVETANEALAVDSKEPLSAQSQLTLDTQAPATEIEPTTTEVSVQIPQVTDTSTHVEDAAEACLPAHDEVLPAADVVASINSQVAPQVARSTDSHDELAGQVIAESVGGEVAPDTTTTSASLVDTTPCSDIIMAAVDEPVQGVHSVDTVPLGGEVAEIVAKLVSDVVASTKCPVIGGAAAASDGTPLACAAKNDPPSTDNNPTTATDMPVAASFDDLPVNFVPDTHALEDGGRDTSTSSAPPVASEDKVDTSDLSTEEGGGQESIAEPMVPVQDAIEVAIQPAPLTDIQAQDEPPLRVVSATGETPEVVTTTDEIAEVVEQINRVPSAVDAGAFNEGVISGDTYECRSGLLVARDPSNDCKFYPCRDADNETSPPLSTAPNTTAAVDTTSFPSNITHRKFHDFTPSSALNWTVADSTIPAEVSAAALRAFLAYNDSSVCDHLAVGITSAERADLPSSRALFHVVMDVSCTLNTTNQTSGVYVLELLTESGPPSVSLTQCGVLANGTLSNWLTQHNHSTACQTPRERLEYIHQPLEHTLHLPKEGSTAHSSHGMFSDLAALMEKPTVLYLFVASVAGIVLLAFGFAVVVGRRRIAAMKRRQMERSILEEVATGRIEERAREAEARRRQQEEEVEDEKTPTETDALDYIGKAHRDKNERRDGDHPSIFTIDSTAKQPHNDHHCNSHCRDNDDNINTSYSVTTTQTVPSVTTSAERATIPVLTTAAPKLTEPIATIASTAATHLPSTTVVYSVAPTTTTAAPVLTTTTTTTTAVAPTTATTTTTTVAPTTTTTTTVVTTSHPLYATTKPPVAPTSAVPTQDTQKKQWIGIDETRPEALAQASVDAFAAYTGSSCGAFHVDLVSFEKLTGFLPKSGQMYSVVARVKCNAAADDLAGGKYILHFDEMPVDSFKLTMCGHVKDSIVTNWIGIHNGTAICQNPEQKTDFANQKVEHVQHTSAIAEYYKRLESGDPFVIGAAVAALVAAGLIVAGLVMLRNRFRYSTTGDNADNQVGDEEESKEEEDDDDEDVELAGKKIKASAVDEVVLNEPATTTSLKAQMKLDTPGVNQEAKFTVCENLKTGELTQLTRDPKNNCNYPPCPAGSRKVEEDVDPYATTLTPATAGSAASSTKAPTPFTSISPSATSANSSGLNTTRWENIDSSHSGALAKASYRAFAAYNRTNVCDEFHCVGVSFEKLLGGAPSAPQVYSVVTHITCSLESEKQVAGKYILHFEENPKDHFELTTCGRVKDNGDITNWITVDQGVTVCQTPAQNAAFQAQPDEHVTHVRPTTSTSFSDFVDKLKAGDGRAMAVAGAAGVACLLLVLVVVVFRSRRARYHETDTASCSGTPNNKVGETDSTTTNDKNGDDSSDDDTVGDKQNPDDTEEESVPRDSIAMSVDEVGAFANSPVLKHQV